MRGDRFPRVPTTHLGVGDAPERRFRLLERVRHEIRARRFSVRTEQAYVSWIRRYVLHHDRRHPRDLGVVDVGNFLSHLTTVRQVAASTQNQALAALRFLYDVVLLQPLERVEGLAPAPRREYVPVVLSQREVRELLGQLMRLLRPACQSRSIQAHTQCAGPDMRPMLLPLRRSLSFGERPYNLR